MSTQTPQPDSHYLEDNAVPIINLCFGGVLLPALLACWLMFFYRVYRWEVGAEAWWWCVAFSCRCVQLNC